MEMLINLVGLIALNIVSDLHSSSEQGNIIVVVTYFSTFDNNKKVEWF